jgi:hypothetical protein
MSKKDMRTMASEKKQVEQITPMEEDFASGIPTW